MSEKKRDSITQKEINNSIDMIKNHLMTFNNQASYYGSILSSGLEISEYLGTLKEPVMWPLSIQYRHMILMSSWAQIIGSDWPKIDPFTEKFQLDFELKTERERAGILVKQLYDKFVEDGIIND